MALQQNDQLEYWMTISRGLETASINRHWEVVITSGSPNLAGAESAMTTRLWTLLLEGMGSGIFSIVTTLRQYRAGSQIDTLETTRSDLDSGNPEDCLPINTAILVSWSTVPKKPRRVSRLYWPFISAAHVGTDTLLTDAALTQLTNAAGNISSPHAINTGTGLAGLQARLKSKATGEIFPLAAPTVSKKIATQRRRLREVQRSVWNA